MKTTGTSRNKHTDRIIFPIFDRAKSIGIETRNIVFILSVGNWNFLDVYVSFLFNFDHVDVNHSLRFIIIIQNYWSKLNENYLFLTFRLHSVFKDFGWLMNCEENKIENSITFLKVLILYIRMVKVVQYNLFQIKR